jgi:hypothetical protein
MISSAFHHFKHRKFLHLQQAVLKSGRSLFAIREGQKFQLAEEELVEGHLLKVEAGEKI